ncbi:hypothetical protein V5799_027878 [Amblyomma americanum]|uniref:Uncharacterized protein n=1 Tax=Amblyomma americanum TaxID=6943 RepID=A0AAQ4DEG5_AMBAM
MSVHAPTGGGLRSPFARRAEHSHACRAVALLGTALASRGVVGSIHAASVPRCRQNISLEEFKAICMQQLQRMCGARLLAVLQGEVEQSNVTG